MGLDLAGCAQLLHVTERTLHNWQSGKHDIPYAAYRLLRLLRLLNRMDLPGESWAGWCFHGGKLWTPEGRSFVGTDGSWWSLLVRRAAMFDQLCHLKHKGSDAERKDACRDASAARAAAVSEASSPRRQPGGARSAGPRFIS
ncbi:VC1465 family Xer recombination activation factor [Paracidovorax cattleyae]|uniref:VC1465 family Xer recombination activation factor n=1 Tax=Paracidovorax cattleyae TaxID=80868 RepID=UPI00336A4406